MDESGQSAVARQWAMLRSVPRAPRKVTASDLAERLRGDGFDVSKRTVERDLQALSARFPLTLDDRAKPYGWAWAREARIDIMPALTASQAVALLLARQHLGNLLPRNLQDDLGEVFAAAERALSTSGWKDWHLRTAVVPSSMPLLPPRIEPDVMETVQLALARHKCLQADYRAKGETRTKPMVIHPLGLVSRG